MSFTRTEAITIAKILGIDRIVLENHIALYPSEIDSTVEGLVRDEITRWTGGISTNFTSIEPKERNFGARIDPSAAKADVQKNIANLLLIGDYAVSAGNWGRSARG
jgi:hypothetical protein